MAIATRGEEGSLGHGTYSVTRDCLPAVRERELREVLQLCGAQPPILLGHRDQGLSLVDFEELVGQMVAVMQNTRPDVVITFGPTGISNHEDHVALHRAAVEAFHRHRSDGDDLRLFFVALPAEAAEQFELDLLDVEKTPTTIIDIGEFQALKIRALRMYRSQEDAQEVADIFETSGFSIEAYHQAYPPLPGDSVATGFWD